MRFLLPTKSRSFGPSTHVRSCFDRVSSSEPCSHRGKTRGWSEMSRVALGILSFLMGVGLAGSGHAEKRVALIVGNAAYIQGQLQNTLNDAILVADVLRSRGFDLVKGRPLLNLDKLAFDDAVRQLGHELRGADVGLFYFAGH